MAHLIDNQSFINAINTLNANHGITGEIKKFLMKFYERKLKININASRGDSDEYKAFKKTLNDNKELYVPSDNTYVYYGAKNGKKSDDVVYDDVVYDDVVYKNMPISVFMSYNKFENIVCDYLFELYGNQFDRSDSLEKRVITDLQNLFLTISPNHPKVKTYYYANVMKLLEKQKNYAIVGSSAVFFMSDKIDFIPSDLDLIDTSDHKDFKDYIQNVFVKNLGDCYKSHEFDSHMRCIIKTMSGINIDIFRSDVSVERNISNYHFSCVRMGIKCNNPGEFTYFVYPSAVISYLGSPSIIDIRNAFAKKNPFELLSKYESRGFKILLNKDIMTMYEFYKKTLVEMKFNKVDVTVVTPTATHAAVTPATVTSTSNTTPILVAKRINTDCMECDKHCILGCIDGCEVKNHNFDLRNNFSDILVKYIKYKNSKNELKHLNIIRCDKCQNLKYGCQTNSVGCDRYNSNLIDKTLSVIEVGYTDRKESKVSVDDITKKDRAVEKVSSEPLIQTNESEKKVDENKKSSISINNQSNDKVVIEPITINPNIKGNITAVVGYLRDPAINISNNHDDKSFPQKKSLRFVLNDYTKFIMEKYNIYLCHDSEGKICEVKDSDKYDSYIHSTIITTLLAPRDSYVKNLFDQFINYNTGKCTIAEKINQAKKFLECF